MVSKKANPDDNKYDALIRINTINGVNPELCSHRPNFEKLTPVFPNSRLSMEVEGGSTALRIVDLISPIGKGQRGMIVSPPKAGKTTLLKNLLENMEGMKVGVIQNELGKSALTEQYYRMMTFTW